MAAQMEQPYPLDPHDDLRFWVEDQTFVASGGEALSTHAHEYEGGDGFEVHDKSVVGARLYYFARFTDADLPDGTVRSVTFHLVGDGSPPQKADRTVSFVMQRSSGV